MPGKMSGRTLAGACEAASLLRLMTSRHAHQDSNCSESYQARDPGQQQTGAMSMHVHQDSSTSGLGSPSRQHLVCLPVGMVLHTTSCLLCSPPGRHTLPWGHSCCSCGLPTSPLSPLGHWGSPSLSVGLTLQATPLMSATQYPRYQQITQYGW